jgi:hypothetical protein
LLKHDFLFVDLSKLRHLRHLRHLPFCFQFYKPFTRLWGSPQFSFSEKMTSLDLLEMYFVILAIFDQYFVKIGRTLM